MLHITTLVLGALRTHCYILRNEDSSTCVVIDPGDEPERVLSQVGQLGLTVKAILLTHGHFDHVGAVRDIVADTGCDVYIHEADLSLPAALTRGPLYYTHTYGEGDLLELAGLSFRVLHTPGHTPGCVCLAVEDALFSGDTLFAGTCGRTDLPGSSHEAMLRSLARLRTLPEHLAVYPGHGDSSTIDAEKAYNPYLCER